MGEIFLELGRWAVSVAAAGAVLGYVAKLTTEHLFSRDLERFRSVLQTQSAVEIERLRGEIQRSASEHSTRFGWLHPKKGEALAVIHREIITASSATRQAAMAADIVTQVGPEAYPMLEERLKEAVTQMKQAISSYRGLRVFLEPPVDRQVRDFLNALQGAQSSVELAGLYLNPKFTANPPARDEAVGYMEHWSKQLDPAEEDFVKRIRQAFKETISR